MTNTTKNSTFKNVYHLLSYIQQNIKAPKDRNNTFGKYKYRTAEDILQSAKQVIPENTSAIITLKDVPVIIGDWHYIKSTATITLVDSSISSEAYAREELGKKGMDVAQLTGATSSYARKYALNGLFAIDESEVDPDKTQNSQQEEVEEDKAINRKQLENLQELIEKSGKDIEKICEFYKVTALSELSECKYFKLEEILNKLIKENATNY